MFGECSRVDGNRINAAPRRGCRDRVPLATRDLLDLLLYDNYYYSDV